jgi:hypothetical protein
LLRFFFFGGFCDRALPAADLDFLLVRESRRTLDATLAAGADVFFLGALRCVRALPAAVLDFLLVEPLVRVLDALVAARFLVTFGLAIVGAPHGSLAARR